jgi:integral membrane protein (TIGR01906 family)
VLAFLGGVATGLAVLALPLALITGSVRATTLDRGFYLAEFERYRIGQTTGLSPDELRSVTDAFLAYFQAPAGRMDVRVVRGNAVEPLFGEREIVHMEDVQALMHLTFGAQRLALGFLMLYVLGGLVLRRRQFLPTLGGVLAAGGGLTIAALGIVGLLAISDFQWLFLQFHLVSFTNDLWLLDPERHNLIRLFPQEFFFDAAVRTVVLAVIQALVLSLLGLLLLWLARRRAAAGVVQAAP